MKKISFILILTTYGLLGCSAIEVAPPQEKAISGKPFEITVPKNLIGADKSLLKGVKIHSFRNRWGKSPVIDFASVNFKEEKSTSKLIAEICKGENHTNTGSTFKSCIYYDSRVSIKENPSTFHITITPYKKRTEQGRNAIYIPISLPTASLKNWYSWMSKQTVNLKYKSTSKYSPESIKGNFDRNLTPYAWSDGESDAALKQFKDTYIINLKNKVAVKVGASFFPYRDGSLVEMRIRGESGAVKGSTTQDWNAAITEALSIIDKVVKE